MQSQAGTEVTRAEGCSEDVLVPVTLTLLTLLTCEIVLQWEQKNIFTVRKSLISILPTTVNYHLPFQFHSIVASGHRTSSYCRISLVLSLIVRYHKKYHNILLNSYIYTASQLTIYP